MLKRLAFRFCIAWTLTMVLITYIALTDPATITATIVNR